jgi:hypothetical protein
METVPGIETGTGNGIFRAVISERQFAGRMK